MNQREFTLSSAPFVSRRVNESSNGNASQKVRVAFRSEARSLAEFISVTPITRTVRANNRVPYNAIFGCDSHRVPRRVERFSANPRENHSIPRPKQSTVRRFVFSRVFSFAAFVSSGFVRLSFSTSDKRLGSLTRYKSLALRALIVDNILEAALYSSSNYIGAAAPVELGK